MYKQENAPLPLHSDLCNSFGTPEVDFHIGSPTTVHVRGGGSFFPGVGLLFLGISDPGGHLFLGRNDWGSFIPRNI